MHTFATIKTQTCGHAHYRNVVKTHPINSHKKSISQLIKSNLSNFNHPSFSLANRSSSGSLVSCLRACIFVATTGALIFLNSQFCFNTFLMGKRPNATHQHTQATLKKKMFPVCRVAPEKTRVGLLFPLIWFLIGIYRIYVYIHAYYLFF